MQPEECRPDPAGENSTGRWLVNQADLDLTPDAALYLDIIQSPREAREGRPRKPPRTTDDVLNAPIEPLSGTGRSWAYASTSAAFRAGWDDLLPDNRRDYPAALRQQPEAKRGRGRPRRSGDWGNPAGF